MRRELRGRSRDAADAQRPPSGNRRQAARDRRLGREGEGGSLVRARGGSRHKPSVRLPRARLGRSGLGLERILVLALSRALGAPRTQDPRGRRGEDVGIAAPAPARSRIRRHGHSRRRQDRDRARRVLRRARRPLRARPGRRRASTFCGRRIRPHLLRGHAPPRARPAQDGRRDVAGHQAGRRGRRAERRDAAARVERRRSHPGRGEGARDQRAHAHGLGLPCGVRPLPDPRQRALSGRRQAARQRTATGASSLRSARTRYSASTCATTASAWPETRSEEGEKCP